MSSSSYGSRSSSSYDPSSTGSYGHGPSSSGSYGAWSVGSYGHGPSSSGSYGTLTQQPHQYSPHGGQPYMLKFLTRQIHVCAGCRLGYCNTEKVPDPPYNICVAHEETRQITNTHTGTPKLWPITMPIYAASG